MKRTRRVRVAICILVLLVISFAAFFATWPKPPMSIGQTAVLDQCHIQYVMEGQGQDVVFLHGSEGSLNDFYLSPVWNALRGQCRLTAFDRPGRDISSPGYYSVDEQVEITHQLLKKLGVDRPILVAHSWSGVLALSYALKYPGEVKGIVLIGGWVYPLDDPLQDGAPVVYPVVGPLAAQYGFRTRDGIIDRLLDEGFGRTPIPANYRADAHQRWCWSRQQLESFMAEIAEANEYLKQISPRYGELTVPIMAMAGDADKAVPPSQATDLAKAVKNGRAILLPGCPHYLQFSSPTEVAHEITEMIRN